MLVANAQNIRTKYKPYHKRWRNVKTLSGIVMFRLGLPQTAALHGLCIVGVKGKRAVGPSLHARRNPQVSCGKTQQCCFPCLAPIAFSLLTALVYWQETMIYTLYGFHILESKPLVKYEHKCAHCHQMYFPQMNCILLSHQRKILHRDELLKKFWAPLLLVTKTGTEATLLTSKKWKRNHYGRLDFDSSMRSCSTISIVQTAISNTFLLWW